MVLAAQHTALQPSCASQPLVLEGKQNLEHVCMLPQPRIEPLGVEMEREDSLG